MPRKYGSRKATVAFLHADPKSLDWVNIHALLRNLYIVKETEFAHSFTECVAIFEQNASTSQSGNPISESDFEPPVYVRRFIGEISETYAHKLKSEHSVKRKVPGSPSTRAAVYLTPNTYFLVAGSIEQCQKAAALFFSELGTNKLAEIFLNISALHVWRSTKQLDKSTLYQYDTEDDLFDACNIDALAERLKLIRKNVSFSKEEILTPEEVQRRLFPRQSMIPNE